jgi:hypothetical protein
MALFKCSECNHDISDKAAFCPNCGIPLENTTRRQAGAQRAKGARILISFALGCAGFIVFAAFWGAAERLGYETRFPRITTVVAVLFPILIATKGYFLAKSRASTNAREALTVFSSVAMIAIFLSVAMLPFASKPKTEAKPSEATAHDNKSIDNYAAANSTAQLNASTTKSTAVPPDENVHTIDPTVLREMLYAMIDETILQKLPAVTRDKVGTCFLERLMDSLHKNSIRGEEVAMTDAGFATFMATFDADSALRACVYVPIQFNELIVDADSRLGSRVAISGIGTSLSDMFLLRNENGGVNSISIDMSVLTREDKIDVLDNCSNLFPGCNIRIYGVVGEVRREAGVKADVIEIY